MDDLLSLAKQFKAVGLIAILIQYKNQKEKEKREKHRTRKKGRSGKRLPGRTLVSASKVRKELDTAASSHVSSGLVPAAYPYGDSSPIYTKRQQVTYPYGDVPVSPHSVRHAAYDSDDDSTMDLKKANARAQRIRKKASNRESRDERVESHKASSGYRDVVSRLAMSSLASTSTQHSSSPPRPSSPSSPPSASPGGSSSSTVHTPASRDTDGSHSSAQQPIFSLPVYTPPAFSIPGSPTHQGLRQLTPNQPTNSDPTPRTGTDTCTASYAYLYSRPLLSFDLSLNRYQLVHLPFLPL